MRVAIPSGCRRIQPQTLPQWHGEQNTRAGNHLCRHRVCAGGGPPECGVDRERRASHLTAFQGRPVARQFPRYTGNRLRWSCRLVGLCNGGSKQVLSKQGLWEILFQPAARQHRAIRRRITEPPLRLCSLRCLKPAPPPNMMLQSKSNLFCRGPHRSNFSRHCCRAGGHCRRVRYGGLCPFFGFAIAMPEAGKCFARGF